MTRSIFSWPHCNALSQCTIKMYFSNATQKEFMKMIWIQKIRMKDEIWHSHSPVYIDKFKKASGKATNGISNRYSIVLKIEYVIWMFLVLELLSFKQTWIILMLMHNPMINAIVWIIILQMSLTIILFTNLMFLLAQLNPDSFHISRINKCLLVSFSQILWH